MKYIKEINALKEVSLDLKIGEDFYESQFSGLGAYFRDTILSDIESLYICAGVHTKHLALVSF